MEFIKLFEKLEKKLDDLYLQLQKIKSDLEQLTTQMVDVETDSESTEEYPVPTKGRNWK